MAVALTDLESIFYAILREEETDTTAYPLILADLLLNGAQQDFCAGRLINPITKEEARKGDLHFLNTDVYYSNVGGTYTTADLAIGATTVFADTTDYPTTGNLYIGGQVVSYSGITTTSFTGVTPILFNRPSGTQVWIAFALPTDFGSVLNVVYNQKIKLPAKNYDDIYEELNSFKGSNYQRQNITSMYESPYRVKAFYTIKDAAYLIPFQLQDTGYPIHLRYEKTPPTMVTTPTPVACTIDNDIYAKMTLGYLAVGEMMWNRGEEERGSRLIGAGISWAKKAYAWYNDTTYESQNGVQYRSAKGKLNI